MLRSFINSKSYQLVMPLVLLASLSGCGKNSNTPEGSASGTAISGSTIIPTPYGNGLSYSFTATAIFPLDPGTNQPVRRFLSGVFPFGQPGIGGSCGAQYNLAQDYQTQGTYYLSFCNYRRAQPYMPNDFFGMQVFGNPSGFGSVVPGVTSLPGAVAVPSKPILGYENDGMSAVAMTKYQQLGVPCPVQYQQLGFTSPMACVQMVVSGVLTLSPAYIQENMPGNTQITRVAMDLRPDSLGGTIFMITPTASAFNIVTF